MNIKEIKPETKITLPEMELLKSICKYSINACDDFLQSLEDVKTHGDFKRLLRIYNDAFAKKLGWDDGSDEIDDKIKELEEEIDDLESDLELEISDGDLLGGWKDEIYQKYKGEITPLEFEKIMCENIKL